MTSWNPGAQRFKGYTAQRDHRPAFLALLHRGGPADRPARSARWRRRAREGRFESEGWRVRKDGTRFWAHVVIDPDPRPGGRADRLRQDHARPDRAPPGRGGAAAQRGAVPPAGPGRHRLRHLHARSRRPGHQLERRRPAHQGLPARRDHRPALLALLHRGGSRERASRARRSRRRCARAASRRRAGACARTAAASGPTSSSTRSATRTAS